MPRKKYTEMPLAEIMRRLKHSSLDESRRIRHVPDVLLKDECESLEVRMRSLIGIINKEERAENYMLFFVMYDIESDKVRTLVSKYLQKQGCTRVQNSIFLADLPIDVYEKIREDLKEVQACYDNHDSILVVPMDVDNLKSMSIIGKSLDVGLIMKTKSTMFF